MTELSITPGSEDWEKLRKSVTETIPGKKSALYNLNALVLGKSEFVPMTYRAHLGMLLFAESATGIPEIDSARVKLILVPRGCGKSSLVTKSLPILRILRDPEYATGIANEKADLAKTFLGDIKHEIQSNILLQTLFPEIIPDNFGDTTWAADRIITKRRKANPTSPTVLATGVGGTVTGVHMNEWVCDDLLSQNAAEAAYRGNAEGIEVTNRWISRLQPLLKSPKRDPLLFIGCIAEDEPVLMADGTWKAIQNVEVGDEVWARKKDGSEDFKPRKVTGVWPQGYSDVVEINVAGRKIVATKDHPFLGREQYWPSSSPCWRQAWEFSREYGESNRGVLMEVFEGMSGSSIECDYDFAWLAGFMWGDGWVTKYERPDGELNYCVNFAKGTHNALNKRAERLLNKYFGDLGGRCYHTANRCVRMDNNEAGRRWERWGLIPGIRAPNKRIPQWVFKASRKCKRAFLHGLCSADGHKTAPRRWSLGLSSKEMVEQAQLLAMTANIRPTLIYDQSGIRQAPNSPKPKWSQLYSVCLNFSRDLTPTKCYGVKEVKPLEIQRPVYDITIEDGDCTFVVRGAECQNTRWWEGDSYEFIEDFWSRETDPVKEFIWTLKLPAQQAEWEDGVIDRPAETQNIKLHRRGEVAVFRFPAIDENGRPIFPERYTIEELRSMQEENPVFYAGQYLLEPTAGAASTFDANWLKTFDYDGSSILFQDNLGEPQHVPLAHLTTYISVDPAFSKKSSSARTAVPVMGTDGERLFLLEDFAERLDSEDDIAAKVLDFYLRYRPQKIFVETIVAQVAVANAIRRRFREEGHGEPPLEEIRSHGQKSKIMRVYGLEHYFKRGIFYYHTTQRRFFNEYISFPRAILRDILDAISFQVPEWEKIFTMTHHGGRLLTREEVLERDAAQIAKVRRAWGGRATRKRR